jgi:methylated-DNA-[protein]-cysteine S-methyltransferase
LLVTCNESGITGCHMGERRAGSRPHPILARAGEQLNEYFAGRRQSFDLPLAARGTGFQQSVWRALTDIPYGVTRSYREIAEAVGSPRAFRAVGAANGRNPIAVIVPCHRVIGADGSLTGFGGGLERKRWLLEHERAAV